MGDKKLSEQFLTRALQHHQLTTRDAQAVLDLEQAIDNLCAANEQANTLLGAEIERRELAEARLAALAGFRLGQFAWEDDDGWHLGCQAMDAEMNTVAQVPVLDWQALADALRAGQKGDAK